MKKSLRRLVGFLSCIVVFCTTYALILPAITLEKELTCPLTEHSHDEGCYTQVLYTQGEVGVCSPARLGVHVHTLDCYDESMALICHRADYCIHVHEESCYDAQGSLWCTLPEIRPHAHTEYCVDPDGSLWCSQPVAVVHSHSAECYGENGECICGVLSAFEHRHGPECFTAVDVPLDTSLLTCPLSEDETHTHGALCFGEWTLHCDTPVHSHNELCYDFPVGFGFLPTPSPDVTAEPSPDVTAEPSPDVTAEPSPETTPDAAPEATPDATPEASLSVSPAPAQKPIQLLTYTTYDTPKDLKAYLTKTGGQYFYNITDKDDHPLPKDENGNYMVVPDTLYELTLGIDAADGIYPGNYFFQLPDGPFIAATEGDFVVEGVHLGSWVLDETGYMLLTFNENANTHSEVHISASMDISFKESSTSHDFDGQIHIVVKPPEVEIIHTELSKYGKQGELGDTERPDPNKIYWTITIKGGEDVKVPGSGITDTITSGNHTYTQSDKARGISFGVDQTDPETGEYIAWHFWTVPYTDITWSEDNTSWHYTIPKTVTCNHCQELTLDTEGWTYYIQYTSTPDETTHTGQISHTNKVTIDDLSTEGWAGVTQGTTTANIIKEGSFITDTAGAAFRWSFDVTIPGMPPGGPADYLWSLWDSMRIRSDHDSDFKLSNQNDLNLATVTVQHQGETKPVPHLPDAGESDLLAWYNSYTSVEEGGTVPYGQEVTFYCRCRCSEDLCPTWGENGCGSLHWDYTDFCTCWTVEGDALFTFTYDTKDLWMLDEYGGNGHRLQNDVTLSKKTKAPDGSWEPIAQANSSARVPIPAVLKKEVTQNYNGQDANYTITVNESMLDLTAGEPLTIRDEMTDTLVYIRGSMVIKAVDKTGEERLLVPKEDYTLEYDGTGQQTDDNGKTVHVLTIEILNPGPEMYILNYDTTLVIPEDHQGSVSYQNSASISLFGESLKVFSQEKMFTDINISAKNYRMTIQKVDAETKAPLAGAVFGLFNEAGGLIAEATTDENGAAMFQTNIREGIILRGHTPYYIQEIASPTGYVRDDVKKWFLFCEETDSSGNRLEECTFPCDIPDILRIPGDTVTFELDNEKETVYVLPNTGGVGTTRFTHAGTALLVSAAGLLLWNRIRKRSGPPRTP